MEFSYEHFQVLVNERLKKFSYDDVKNILSKESQLYDKFTGYKSLNQFLDDYKKMMIFLKTNTTDKKRLSAILITFEYILKNFDQIPDFIPFIGLLDDSVIMEFCVKYFNEGE